MKVILYSTDCPKCKVLEKKLDEKNIEYETIKDTKLMIKRGFVEAPKLDVDGELMDFSEALRWVSGGME